MAQKGGCGKTTLAVNLAVAATLAEQQCGLIDLDQQGSSYRWYRQRKHQWQTTVPGVIASQAVALPDIIEQIQPETDLLFIDTAPQVSIDTELIARNVDIILVPVKPSLADFDTIPAILSIAERVGKKAFLVLSMVPTSGTLLPEAQEYLKLKKYNVAPAIIYNRTDFIRSYTSGKGVQEFKVGSSASKDIYKLYTWLFDNL